MGSRETFDAWAEAGRDREMERRHWHTAGPALERMPIESGDVVIDLGCGTGYAARVLCDAGAGRAIGLDGAPAMVRRARAATVDDRVDYVLGDFQALSVARSSIDHVWSMEALYYAPDPLAALEEVARVLRPGGTFFCAVNYYEENVHSHGWADRVDVPMTRWSLAEYRSAFRQSGLAVASQTTIPDREVEIPPESAFPTDSWETRGDMVERYRELGTLLTVGITPGP